MIDASVLENIINPAHILQINEECLKRGLTNVRLYKTIFTKDKDYIHFLVKDPDYSISPGKDLNLFTISGLENLIANKLNNEVKLVLESHLKESYKEAVLQNVVVYQEGNEAALKDLFINKIVSFSNKGYTDFPTITPIQSMGLYSPVIDKPSQNDVQTFVDKLKETPALWEYVKNNPSILVEAKNIIENENLTSTIQPLRFS